MSLFSKLNQIKELRSQAKNLQSQLAQESVTLDKHGTVLTMNGNQEITKLEINPEYLSEAKKQKLEEIISELHNDAVKKIQRIMAEKMKGNDSFKNLLNQM